jgi:hypothetical protein
MKNRRTSVLRPTCLSESSRVRRRLSDLLVMAWSVRKCQGTRWHRNVLRVAGRKFADTQAETSWVGISHLQRPSASEIGRRRQSCLAAVRCPTDLGLRPRWWPRPGPSRTSDVAASEHPRASTQTRSLSQVACSWAIAPRMPSWSVHALGWGMLPSDAAASLRNRASEIWDNSTSSSNCEPNTWCRTGPKTSV